MIMSGTGACDDRRCLAQSEVDTDSIGNVLCKKAQDLQAVAIVMASHSKSSLQQFFLGRSVHCMHSLSRGCRCAHCCSALCTSILIMTLMLAQCDKLLYPSRFTACTCCALI